MYEAKLGEFFRAKEDVHQYSITTFDNAFIGIVSALGYIDEDEDGDEYYVSAEEASDEEREHASKAFEMIPLYSADLSLLSYMEQLHPYLNRQENIPISMDLYYFGNSKTVTISEFRNALQTLFNPTVPSNISYFLSLGLNGFAVDQSHFVPLGNRTPDKLKEISYDMIGKPRERNMVQREELEKFYRLLPLFLSKPMDISSTPQLSL